MFHRPSEAGKQETRSDAKAVSKTQFYIQIWRRSAVDIQLGGFSACICAQIAWLNRHGDGIWQLYSIWFCVVADRELWWVRKWCGKHQQRKKQFLCKLLFSCNVVILLSVILTHEVYSKNYYNRKHNQVLGVITHYLRTQGVLGLSICV